MRPVWSRRAMQRLAMGSTAAALVAIVAVLLWHGGGHRVVSTAIPTHAAATPLPAAHGAITPPPNGAAALVPTAPPLPLLLPDNLGVGGLDDAVPLPPGHLSPPLPASDDGVPRREEQTVASAAATPALLAGAVPAIATPAAGPPSAPAAPTAPLPVPVLRATPRLVVRGHAADLPTILRIPRLQLAARVDPVGYLNGAMAPPSSVWHVGWLADNAAPGQAGNAVIDGHLDSPAGVAAFWDLRRLVPGDRVYVETGGGRTLIFAVIGTASYRTMDAPLDLIFGPSSERHLNLITCAGSWDRRTHAYEQRLVVYTRLVGA